VNSRQRFQETLSYGNPDRPPLFEDGLRENVLETWQTQGLSPNSDLTRLFTFDQREEIDPKLDSDQDMDQLVDKSHGLEQFLHSLDENESNRMPEDWSHKLAIRKLHMSPNILWVGRGFFLTLGIEDGCSFVKKMYLIVDHPDFVSNALYIQNEFAVRLAERIMQEISIDALLFSEPIAGNHGSLVSPRLYEKLVLPAYQPLFEMAKQHKIHWLILRTYANPRVLLESQVRFGFNVLWAVERNTHTMDYINIRREFGRSLRLVGGIDVDALRFDKDVIHREIEEKALPLVQDGGYIPLADGRIRQDVSWENYQYYRCELERVTNSP
jgi:hypothetical protein